MKQFATEDIEEIPNGVYSVKRGVANGVYVMLKMPEEASGEVFWRFYPLDDTARPVTSPGEVLSIVEAGRDENRQPIPSDENPFSYLEGPLRAAVDQIGQAYLDAMSAVTSDNLTKRIRQFLNRDDLLESQPSLFKFFSDWVELPLPSDVAQRMAMRDPVRVMNRVAPTRAGLSLVVDGLNSLREAILSEGFDRPISRPATRQPTITDLELVAWELIISPTASPPLLPLLPLPP